MRICVLAGCAMVAGLGSAAALHLAGRGRSLEQQLAAARIEQSSLEHRLEQLPRQLQAERQRLAGIEAENDRLLEAIASGAITNAARAAPPQITRESIDARFKRGQALERDGDLPGALAEYLWCYDRGYLRTGALLGRVAQLAERFPEARTALVLRRDEAYRRVLADAEDADAFTDFVALNRALKDEARSLALFERLPANRPERRELARGLLDLLIANRRYADVMLVLPPYEHTIQRLESRPPVSAQNALARDAARAKLFSAAQLEAQRIARERAQAAQRRATVAETALHAEVLAGSGDLARARILVEKLLAHDNTADTRAVLRKHLGRAGHPELLGEVAPP